MILPKGLIEDRHDRLPGSRTTGVEERVRFLSSGHGDPHLAADSPNKSGQFAGDGGDDHGRLFAVGDHLAIPRAEPGLRVPCDIA